LSTLKANADAVAGEKPAAFFFWPNEETTMPTILELRGEANNSVVLGRAILDKAQAEKRAMTAEETVKFDQFMAAYDSKMAEVKGIEDGEARTRRLAAATTEMEKRAGRQVDPPNPDPDAAGDGAGGNPNVFKFKNRGNHRGMCGVTSTREINLAGDKRLAKMLEPATRQKFAGWLQNGDQYNELRALQVDLDTAGGFLVTPQQFAAELIAIVDDQVFIRQLATVITLTSATTLGVPSRDVDIADSDWTSELNTGNEDSALAFGKRELQPHPLAKRIKVSNKLTRAGALDVESIVRDRLAYKFGITQEKAFLTGDGVQKPLGLFIASAGNGISTARDIQTGSTTNFTADALIAAKYFLKPQYWASARWLFHRFGIQRIRQLKDSNGQYLWAPGIGQASLRDGVPATILELPYVISEYVPSTFTTGLYVGMLGDFSFYWIVEALGMQLQRLVELYAATNQTGFIARAEVDGAPVLEEPFVRLITN
jgi:HK97 family phage major capsid protein